MWHYGKVSLGSIPKRKKSWTFGKFRAKPELTKNIIRTNLGKRKDTPSNNIVQDKGISTLSTKSGGKRTKVFHPKVMKI